MCETQKSLLKNVKLFPTCGFYDSAERKADRIGFAHALSDMWPDRDLSGHFSFCPVNFTYRTTLGIKSACM